MKIIALVLASFFTASMAFGKFESTGDGETSFSTEPPTSPKAGDSDIHGTDTLY